MDAAEITALLVEGTTMEGPHWTEPARVLTAKRRGSRIEVQAVGTLTKRLWTKLLKPGEFTTDDTDGTDKRNPIRDIRDIRGSSFLLSVWSGTWWGWVIGSRQQRVLTTDGTDSTDCELIRVIREIRGSLV